MCTLPNSPLSCSPHTMSCTEMTFISAAILGCNTLVYTHYVRGRECYTQVATAVAPRPLCLQLLPQGHLVYSCCHLSTLTPTHITDKKDVVTLAAEIQNVMKSIQISFKASWNCSRWSCSGLTPTHTIHVDKKGFVCPIYIYSQCDDHLQ